jgi:hypothetical protein
MNSGYPVIKIKLATCQCVFLCILKSSDIKIAFNWKLYLQCNKDLPRNYDEKECIEHFYDKGQFENRFFSVDSLNEQKKYILNLLHVIKLKDIKNYIEKHIII